jgi:hypothetical protein
MAVFTKTYVQCDLCEQQRELPANGDGWFRCEANISKLGASNAAGEKVSTRTTDICASCYGAIQDGEFSNLFFAEKSNGAKPAAQQPPKIAPVS